MDKLYDLMVMGAKYCLLCSTQLEDMIQVTHASSLREQTASCCPTQHSSLLLCAEPTQMSS